MNISVLIQRTRAAGEPEHTEVVMPSFDHSYSPVNRAYLAKAIRRDGEYSEYYDGMNLATDEELVDVLVLV